MGCGSSIDASKKYETACFSIPEDKALPMQNDALALLAMKCVWLCHLSYNTSKSKPENLSDENLHIDLLQISNYKAWYASIALEDNTGTNPLIDVPSSEKGESHTAGGVIAITGIMANISADISDPRSFICFRGTKSLADLRADALSAMEGALHANNGDVIAHTGLGMLNHYKAVCSVRDQEDNKNIVETAIEYAKAYGNEIIISGHSLGAAMANLCAAYIRHEFPEVEVTLVTFGSPRVFTSPTVSTTSTSTRHLRFVNPGDLITLLGDELELKLHHVVAPILKHKNNWHNLPETGDFVNFPYNPVNFDANFALFKGFLSTKANKHRLTTPDGYHDQVFNSHAYQSAVKSLQEPYKSSFARLTRSNPELKHQFPS